MPWHLDCGWRLQASEERASPFSTIAVVAVQLAVILVAVEWHLSRPANDCSRIKPVLSHSGTAYPRGISTWRLHLERVHGHDLLYVPSQCTARLAGCVHLTAMLCRPAPEQHGMQLYSNRSSIAVLRITGTTDYCDG